jgi:hypothetical protein
VYELIKGRDGRVDLLIEGDCNDVVHLDFVPRKRQRVHEADFDLAELEPTGVTARGRRLAPKPVARIKRIRTDNGNGAKPVDKAAGEDDTQRELF